MLIHTIYLRYNLHIQCISNRNFLYIQLKFIWYIWYMHGICNAYNKYIPIYDNNNLPGPCTLTHPVLVPGTQHQPVWTYGSWIFPTLLMYQGYRNRLHHERLARCPLSHEWAVRVADECHETLKTRGTCYISCIYKYKYCIYIVFT